jgi:hypothetical protein
MPPFLLYSTDLDWGPSADGTQFLRYVQVGDEMTTEHGMPVDGLEDTGSGWISNPDGSVRIRDLDPYDAVNLASAGVPQPVAAIRVAILRGGMLAQELEAVVAPDNTVATLMLETGAGTYVRYGGDWQLLSDDSDSLEDMALVTVAAGAVDMWDAADAARTTLTIVDLPTSTVTEGVEYIQEPTDTEPEEGITAAGISLPEVRTVEDLSLALRFASAHPQARWYVAKRAKALGAAGQVPPEWGQGVVLPFATRATG